jgi:hypothetical protein
VIFGTEIKVVSPPSCIEIHGIIKSLFFFALIKFGAPGFKLGLNDFIGLLGKFDFNGIGDFGFRHFGGSVYPPLFSLRHRMIPKELFCYAKH